MVLRAALRAGMVESTTLPSAAFLAIKQVTLGAGSAGPTRLGTTSTWGSRSIHIVLAAALAFSFLLHRRIDELLDLLLVE